MANLCKTQSLSVNKKTDIADFFRNTVNDFKKNYVIYLMVFPVIVYYFIFCYIPMYGASIAFKEFTPAKGIIGSPWIGVKNFIDFFTNPYFYRILRNTLTISISTLVFSFPAPIILALLLNELKGKAFTRIVQTISYMPHFISLVVICALISQFTADNGIVTYLLNFIGLERSSLLLAPKAFVPIYVISDIWQNAGWDSIIYIAALAGISQDQYEAAKIDGAGRWQQMIHVTLPGIAPTIIILLILRIGGLLNVGYEKIILLYNPAIYETSDVISSFVYRQGLLEFNWSYSTAVGLFNSAVNFFFLISANWLSKKTNETSLW